MVNGHGSLYSIDKFYAVLLVYQEIQKLLLSGLHLAFLVIVPAYLPQFSIFAPLLFFLFVNNIVLYIVDIVALGAAISFCMLMILNFSACWK